MVRPILHTPPLRSCLVLGLLLLHGCKTAPAPQPVQPAASGAEEDVPGWMHTASPADQARLGQLNGLWRQALGEAGKGGFRRAVAAEGRLLEPRAALPRPQPAPGSYMCRLIQLGSTVARGRAFSASSRSDFCYVGVDDEGRLWLAKQTGALRRQGYLWDDWNPNRLVFLGSLASGERDAPPTYGSMPARDRVGVMERIGPLRFRLVTPSPGGRFKLEVLELTPAPTQNEE
ncbi:MAG TPA: DUF4893 domain-containing protein [Allosphingosinicella sp.]|jgi:hypothetical protein